MAAAADHDHHPHHPLPTIPLNESQESVPYAQKATVRNSAVEKKLAQLELGIRPDAKSAWIKTAKADSFFGLVILGNALFLGIDVSVSDSGAAVRWVMWFIETVFLIVFIWELYLRVRQELPDWRNFFDSWGIFDTAVTVFGCLDAWLFTLVLNASSDENPLNSFAVLRVFRLLRLVRLIRVLRMFSDLVMLIETMVNSMKAIGWIALLLGMTIYVGAILTAIMIGIPYKGNEDVDLFFGSMLKCIYSHMAVVTTENWPDYSGTAIEVNPLWGVYFVLIIIFTNFLLTNMMVGIICERVIIADAEREAEVSEFAAESDVFRSTLQTLFAKSDKDSNGSITYAELREMLQMPETRQILDAFGLNIGIPPKVLHQILRINREGPSSFEEFYDSCIRLCGSKGNIHSLFIQHDVNKSGDELLQRLEALEQQVQRALQQGRSFPSPAPSPKKPPPPNPAQDLYNVEGQIATIQDLNKRMEKCEMSQEDALFKVKSLMVQATARSGKQAVPGSGRTAKNGMTGMGPPRAAVSRDAAVPGAPATLLSGPFTVEPMSRGPGDKS